MTHDIRKFMNVLNEQFTPEEMNKGIGYDDRPAEEPKDEVPEGEEEVDEGLGDWVKDKFMGAVDNHSIKHGTAAARAKGQISKTGREWAGEYMAICQTRGVAMNEESIREFLKKKKKLDDEIIDQALGGTATDDQPANAANGTGPGSKERKEPTIGAPGVDAGTKAKNQQPDQNDAQGNQLARQKAAANIGQLKKNVATLTKKINGPGTPEEKSKLQAKLDATKKKILQAQGKQVKKTVMDPVNAPQLNLQKEMGSYLTKTRSQIKAALANDDKVTAHKLETELVNRAEELAGDDGILQLKKILKAMKAGNLNESFRKIAKLFERFLIEKKINDDVKAFLAENYIAEDYNRSDIIKIMMKAVTYTDGPATSSNTDDKKPTQKNPDTQSSSEKLKKAERIIQDNGITVNMGELKSVIDRTENNMESRVKGIEQLIHPPEDAKKVMAAFMDNK